MNQCRYNFNTLAFAYPSLIVIFLSSSFWNRTVWALGIKWVELCISYLDTTDSLDNGTFTCFMIVYEKLMIDYRELSINQQSFWNKKNTDMTYCSDILSISLHIS